MIIIGSKSQNCIRSMFNLLENRYVNIKNDLNINIGYHSAIVIDDDKAKNIPDYLINELKIFCEGYVSGWDAYIDNPDYSFIP